ncbi:transmembrane protein 198 isoform X2 [Lycorma delicatula]|uniref:transmembrane protein 198 isoform X1 n=1 Tax=Lycorma delicatula TaxID=130591 RepID=UPI003F50EBAF
MSAGQLVPLDRDRGPMLNNTTIGPPVVGSPSIIPTLINHCHHADIEHDYDVIVATICAMYLLFGVVYCLFGYRCFKAVMFLTGFIFGSVVIYLICIQDRMMMPAYGNAGVALCAGLLFGLITMLVQYVGLFMTGFHTGLLVAVASLAISDQVYKTPTLLTTTASLLGSGMLFATLNLHFQKGLTVVGTSMYGAAIMAGGTDYFVENLLMVKWLWGRITTVKKSRGAGGGVVGMQHMVGSGGSDHIIPHDNDEQLTCWFSWLILSFWPSMFILGLIVQFAITGRGIHHQQMLPIKHRHHNSNNIHRMKVRTREQRAELHQKKYRYLYQVRTAHGDVISQNYVQALQRKVVGTGNCGSGGMTGAESSTLQSDATHLTILPPEQQHHLYHPDDNEDDDHHHDDLQHVQHSRSHVHHYR